MAYRNTSATPDALYWVMNNNLTNRSMVYQLSLEGTSPTPGVILTLNNLTAAIAVLGDFLYYTFSSNRAVTRKSIVDPSVTNANDYDIDIVSSGMLVYSVMREGREGGTGREGGKRGREGGKRGREGREGGREEREGGKRGREGREGGREERVGGREEREGREGGREEREGGKVASKLFYYFFSLVLQLCLTCSLYPMSFNQVWRVGWEESREGGGEWEEEGGMGGEQGGRGRVGGGRWDGRRAGREGESGRRKVGWEESREGGGEWEEEGGMGGEQGGRGRVGGGGWDGRRAGREGESGRRKVGWEESRREGESGGGGWDGRECRENEESREGGK